MCVGSICDRFGMIGGWELADDPIANILRCNALKIYGNFVLFSFKMIFFNLPG